jgi:hypothetical protein
LAFGDDDDGIVVAVVVGGGLEQAFVPIVRGWRG